MDTNNTLPVWPDSLGFTLNSGYTHTLATINTIAMTAGVSRARRSIDEPVSEFSIVFKWTPQQLQQFRIFARHQIEGTAEWFVMPLWSGGEMSPHVVRIKTANKYQLQLPHWQVSFVVECTERFRLSDEIGESLLQWDLSDLMRAGKAAKNSMCEMGSIFRNWMSC